MNEKKVQNSFLIQQNYNKLSLKCSLKIDQDNFFHSHKIAFFVLFFALFIDINDHRRVLFNIKFKLKREEKLTTLELKSFDIYLNRKYLNIAQ